MVSQKICRHLQTLSLSYISRLGLLPRNLHLNAYKIQFTRTKVRYQGQGRICADWILEEQEEFSRYVYEVIHVIPLHAQVIEWCEFIIGWRSWSFLARNWRYLCGRYILSTSRRIYLPTHCLQRYMFCGQNLKTTQLR